MLKEERQGEAKLRKIKETITGLFQLLKLF